MLRGQAVIKFRAQGRELRPVTVPGRGRKAHELALRLQSLQDGLPLGLMHCTLVLWTQALLGRYWAPLYPHWTWEG